MAVTILKNHPDSEVREFDTLYEGCVLALREVNGYDDSDFVAVCWDETEDKVVTYTYATTRCWTYMNGAKVDAPLELRVRLANKAAEKVASRVDGTVAEIRGEVVKGATVKVVGGRKYLGREGKVFWVGEKKNPYTHRPEVRVGMEDETGKFFLPVEQVTVTECPLSPERFAAEVDARLTNALRATLHNDGIGVPVAEVWHIVERAMAVKA